MHIARFTATESSSITIINQKQDFGNRFLKMTLKLKILNGRTRNYTNPKFIRYDIFVRN